VSLYRRDLSRAALGAAALFAIVTVLTLVYASRGGSERGVAIVLLMNLVIVLGLQVFAGNSGTVVTIMTDDQVSELLAHAGKGVLTIGKSQRASAAQTLLGIGDILTHWSQSRCVKNSRPTSCARSICAILPGRACRLRTGR